MVDTASVISIVQPSSSNQSQDQTSESLVSLDVDMPTILEDQGDEVELPTIEEMEDDTNLMVSSSATPTHGPVLPQPHLPMVSQTQPDDESIPPSDENLSYIVTWRMEQLTQMILLLKLMPNLMIRMISFQPSWK